MHLANSVSYKRKTRSILRTLRLKVQPARTYVAQARNEMLNTGCSIGKNTTIRPSYLQYPKVRHLRVNNPLHSMNPSKTLALYPARDISVVPSGLPATVSERSIDVYRGLNQLHCVGPNKRKHEPSERTVKNFEALYQERWVCP